MSIKEHPGQLSSQDTNTGDYFYLLSHWRPLESAVGNLKLVVEVLAVPPVAGSIGSIAATNWKGTVPRRPK